jgi:uncharacterized membrane protein
MFSDGVIAIIITIMVLELAQPAGPTWKDFVHEWRHFAIYALSFLGLGIYWNSHHQLFHIVDRINKRVVWVNLIVLFWLSLIPYVTAWVGNQGALPAPVAIYVAVHLMSGLSFLVLVETLIRENGADSPLARLVGGDIKGKVSMGLYLLAFGLSFVGPIVSLVLCGIVGLIWIVPDWRMGQTA